VDFETALAIAIRFLREGMYLATPKLREKLEKDQVLRKRLLELVNRGRRKRYVFNVTLTGSGNNIISAWQDAKNSLPSIPIGIDPVTVDVD